METNLLKPLKVVNASAGSGKTYTLVYTYLSLLLKSSHADTFTKIVAMTFTNKAALEMKVRIIRSLEVLAFPEQFLPKERKYEKSLCEELRISPEELQKRSIRTLRQIMHRYEDFMVLTIDKFNLKLLRSFSRDLDLPPDFDVVVDEKEVLSKVLETVMSEIGTEQNEGLSKLALSFSESKLQNDERWDFQNELKEFSSILTKEQNQSILEDLVEMEYSEERFHQLKAEREGIQKAFLEKIKEAFVYFRSQGIEGMSSQMSNGSTTFNGVKKMEQYDFVLPDLVTEATLRHLRDGSKSKPGIPFISNKIEELQKQLDEIFPRIQFLGFVLKDYHNFALLKVVAQRLLRTRSDEKILLISEFNKLLSGLVQNVEAPFIYDRLGYRYQHFLLDEFQDTSRMQWLNLIPLVHEFISQYNLCFVVGDPKQSIYRFKNGLAEQFVTLPEIYNPEGNPDIALKSTFFEMMGERKNLTENWRSAKNIVKFNNQFFTNLQGNMPLETKEFYEGLTQEVTSEIEGLVQVTIDESETEDKEDSLFDHLLSWIRDCEKDGFDLSDITILGRTNKDCNRWAQRLTKEGYSVVSADSLQVNTDLEVKYILSYLQKRLFPSSEFASKNFISYCVQVKSLPLSTYESYFTEFEHKGRTYKKIDPDKFIADFFPSSDEFFQPFETIHDLMNKFCKMAGIEPLENHYVHHLLDMAFQFDINFGPDLQQFITDYNNQGKKSAVQIPESKNALNIMTVHKSKGLEFPIVMIPEVTLKDDVSRQKRLVKYDGEILNISLNSKIFSPYAGMIQDEKNQQFTDEVNNLYVGFTRPIERLYARIHKGKSKDETTDLLINVLSHSFEVGFNKENILLFGNRLKKESISDHQSIQDTFNPHSVKDFLWFPSIALSKEGLSKEESNLSEAQNYGTQFHFLLSKLERLEELDKILNDSILRGEIEVAFKDKIREDCEQIFNDHLNELYSRATTIHSEKSIIDPKTNENHIPDKVLILPNKEAIILDFKTGQESKKHQSQVQTYVRLIQEMGYTTSGCLLYTENNQLVWLDSTLF